MAQLSSGKRPQDGGCGGILSAVRYDQPLLSKQIAEEQSTPEDRFRILDAEHVVRWQAVRDQAARTWKAARRVLASLAEEERRELLARWNAAPYPGRSEYFADFVRHQAVRGESNAQPPN